MRRTRCHSSRQASVARLLLEEVGLPSSSTNAASYMGLCRQNTEQVQLTVEERSLAMETLLELNKKYNGRNGAAAGPLAEGRDWLAMEKARVEGKESIPGWGCLAACGGPMSKIVVRADWDPVWVKYVDPPPVN